MGNPTQTICNIDGCEYDMAGMAPNHYPTDRCQSGKRNHCTCDLCF